MKEGDFWKGDCNRTVMIDSIDSSEVWVKGSPVETYAIRTFLEEYKKVESFDYMRGQVYRYLGEEYQVVRIVDQIKGQSKKGAVLLKEGNYYHMSLDFLLEDMILWDAKKLECESMTTITWGFFCKVPDEVLKKVFQEWVRLPQDPLVASPYQCWVRTEYDTLVLDEIPIAIKIQYNDLLREGIRAETLTVSTSISCVNLSHLR